MRPEGARLALLIFALGVRLWAQTSPAARLEIQLGHAEPVEAAAFSPDGKLAITGSSRLVTLWDIETRRQIYQVNGDWLGFKSLAFPSNAEFLTGAVIGSNSLFEVNTGRAIASKYKVLDSCANGSLILTAEGNDRLEVRELKSGKSLLALRFDATRPNPMMGRLLACSQDQRVALVAGTDGQGIWRPQLWDLKSGRLVRSLGEKTVFMALSPDGLTAATVVPGERVVHVWDTQNGNELQQLAGLREPSLFEAASAKRLFGEKSLNLFPQVSAVAFSPDSKLLAAAGFGNLTLVWDVASGKPISKFKATGVSALRSTLVFSPDNSQLLIGSASGGVEIYDVALKRLEFGKPLAAVPGGPPVLGGIMGGIGGGSAPPPPPPPPGSGGTSRPIPKTAPPVVVDPEPEFPLKEAVLRAKLGGLMALTGSECRASPDGRYLFLLKNGTGLTLPNMDGPLLYLDLKTGRYDEWARVPSVSSLTFTTDSRMMVLGHADSSVTLWDLTKHTLLRKIDGAAGPMPKGFSPFPDVAKYPAVSAVATDGKTVLVGYRDGTLRTINAESGESKPSQNVAPQGVWIDDLTLSPKGIGMLVGMSSHAGQLIDEIHSFIDASKLPGTAGLISLLNVGKIALTIKSRLPSRGAAVFTPDGRSVAVTDGSAVSLYDSISGDKRFELPDSGSVRRVAMAVDGKRLLTASTDGGVALWNLATRKVLWKIPRTGNGGIVALGFIGDQRILVSQSDGISRFIDASDGHWIAMVAIEPDMNWVAVTPDGRFDTSNFDNTIPLHWIAADAPLKPLPIEIFMRDYYEPRLLSRVLSGESLPPMPGIAQLNRLLPKVALTGIESEPDGRGEKKVHAEIEETRDPKTGRTSGVQNVRLFRGGRLVASVAADGGTVELNNGKASVHFRHLRVSSGDRLSVYGFNNSGVKTPTLEYSYVEGKLTPVSENLYGVRMVANSEPLPGRRRAWLITVGVGVTAVPGLNLHYAANDAARLRDDLARELKESRRFRQVVIAPLISDAGHPEGANKAAIQKVLADLSIGGAHPAGRDDLVVISFSSHGYADNSGRFYLIPSDAGKGLRGPLKGNWDRLLAEAISSDELSRWLYGVDARQIVLILDTCQSAASVEGGGFKPGPMGSRGLGQLAYDKGLTVLVAAQSSGVAVESSKIEQGVLTYALTHDGLEQGLADWKPHDGKIGLLEWLRYGANRVPDLWNEIKSTHMHLSQEPALFDFSHLAQDEILREGARADDKPPAFPLPAVQLQKRPGDVIEYSRLLEIDNLMPPVERNRESQTGMERTNARDGQTYVWIPPGSFMMGCSEGDGECQPQERPAHRVTLTHGFWMGRTPVTQEAFQAVMGANPSRFPGDKLPVEHVRLSEAQEYCEAIGMRLPSEAEWEWAARGGSSAARYGALGEVAWYRGNSGGKTHISGQKPANGYGLYDMLGNVTQWVADRYGAYAPEEARDPAGADALTNGHTVRGSSYASAAAAVRVSARRGDYPESMGSAQGFRCAGP